ncbi:hypothetical protein AHMF7605_16435 [Adhaeribacter arboris]|uniref:Uncharacterized protein n=1 Tax=Adhaeribacter arboris TaxID=2072846 RepID=A0A2T2YHJ1_9BACT|nr:hypothetical protein AHMF7605_16435 [Adhaeribacter arboris]
MKIPAGTKPLVCRVAETPCIFPEPAAWLAIAVRQEVPPQPPIRKAPPKADLIPAANLLNTSRIRPGVSPVFLKLRQAMDGTASTSPDCGHS